MKKFVIFLLCLLVHTAHSVSICQAAGCECDKVEEVMALTLESVNDNSLQVIEKIMIPPDMGSVTNCLVDVRAGLSGFFTLSLPSIEDLLNGICNAIVDEIYSAATAYLAQEVSGVSTLFEFFDIYWGAEYGFSSNSNTGNSLWTIEGEIITFTITEHNVDLSGTIDDLFN